MQKVIITDHVFKNFEMEKQVFSGNKVAFSVNNCTTGEEVIASGKDADGILVTFAPITEKVIRHLSNCKIIVRYGIGTDNVDLQAAKNKGIKVCNVPDYGTDEVADHTISLALSLARQLQWVESQLRNGQWFTTTPQPIQAFREMNFVSLGFGRIARAVLHRAKAFGFQLFAYDPFVDPEAMKKEGVSAIDFEGALKIADILSLHLPLNQQTQHMINYETMQQMKKSSILLNTSRGGLINTPELAKALDQELIAAAGIDVFEQEPLPADHPLRKAKNALLTSHIAWYSEASIRRLQKSTAEEIVRGLKGEPVKNLVNP